MESGKYANDNETLWLEDEECGALTEEHRQNARALTEEHGALTEECGALTEQHCHHLRALTHEHRQNGHVDRRILHPATEEHR